MSWFAMKAVDVFTQSCRVFSQVTEEPCAKIHGSTTTVKMLCSIWK